LTGTIIAGRYRVDGTIGRGGMAVVYKAIDTRLETEVAVKVIATENLPPKMLERALKRFEREAKALARLNHPNIVKVMDYGEHEGQPYLIMPYLSGGTLKAKLGKPMPWADVVELILPVAEALRYAHSEHMIHRDVKPSNIILTRGGYPMLTDFGIAKLLDLEDTVDLTGTSAAMGTPEYMAPEQARAKSVDQRADIYSLGIVLYEMATGRKPFTANTPIDVLIKQATEPLPSPKKFVPDLPDYAEAILLKALTKKPEHRYQTMDEMYTALKGVGQIANLSPVAPKPRPRKEQTATIAEPLLHEPTISMEQPHARSKLPWLALGGAALGIALLCVLFGWALSGGVANLFPTHTPSATFTPPVTSTSIATSTPRITPTPVLGVGSTWISPKDGMTMLYIPAGDFSMGSNDGSDDEKPVHTVYLDAYWIDQTEVTNDMFAEFVSDTAYETDAEKSGSSWTYQNGSWDQVNGANWNHPRGPGSNLSGLGNHPVVHVSWNDAKAYCEWRGDGTRLPTEAEWEKAAGWDDDRREQRVYPWGDAFDGSRLNFCDKNCPASWADKTVDDGYEFTAPIGSYPLGASFYDLLDMAGNVWEWVSDWYDAYPGNTVSNDSYGTKYRVLRGGSWDLYEDFVRSSNRDRADPFYANDLVGFRCSRSP
jgi:formylglycine-generating enzyme required for sulfatase activity/tRNA A-37 threonylcarbamoyl transferase component Bud32